MAYYYSTMPRSLEISDATPDDIPIIVHILRTTFIDTYTDATPDLTYEAVLDHLGDAWVENKAAFYRDVISHTEDVVVLARLGGTAAGFCRVRADRSNGGLYVLPEYQGGGVGVRLLAAVALRVSLDEPFRLTVVPGTPAERFYEHLGFTPTRRDLSAELPRLRGGAIIPQVELAITPERAQETLRRLRPILDRPQD